MNPLEDEIRILREQVLRLLEDVEFLHQSLARAQREIETLKARLLTNEPRAEGPNAAAAESPAS